MHTEAQAELERVLLDAALAAHGGHRQHAARSLGLSRNTMTRKLGSSRKKRH
ncbi:MAG: helix-turn-helix domain-containing protein [Dokdonella sp.]